MSHWAELDENNRVIRVIVGNDSEPDEGLQWIEENLGGTWVKTSYNSYGGKRFRNGVLVGDDHFRYNYASIGYVYDSEGEAFYDPNPPEDGRQYVLDRSTFLWVEI